MTKALVPAGLLLLATACGIPDDALLTELSDGQRTSLCEELADFDSVTLECDGVTLTYDPTPVGECTADYASLPAGCSATVGDERACLEVVLNITCDTHTFDGPCAALLDDSCLADAE